MTGQARLLLLAVALAGLVGFEAMQPGAVEPPPAPPGLPASPPPPAQPPARPTAELAAIVLARPLLSPTRRPYVPPPTPAAALPEPPRLTGTLVGTFGRRALFARGDGRPSPAVEEAGTVGEWTVQEIRPGAVTLLGPGGTRELRVAAGRGTTDRAEPDLAAPAWSWTNPCGRPHQRGTPTGAGRAARCGVMAADLGRPTP